MASVSPAALLLKRQLKEMQSSQDNSGISVGLINDNNIFEWEVMLMINDDCKYYGGGNFRAHLVFPRDYPHMPPSLTFQDPIPFHPNIYPDGRLCISILHPPEEDQYGYEKASERWSPVQTPGTILVSTISLFHDPNDESAANVEAARLFREEREGKNKDFRRRCRKCVRDSLGED
ncbi:ubiquitin-conjugating enzyme E2 [Thelonectria olida]|uniref:Ubiquitin-conjugating enzyme E2 2 n=1 Tax=Thelonectria olida TaxID=1576542 RepID=A0A9P8WC08_9HYPO|nr:ubiquitin-conjugating enzyme E2 [Thelonectria olida]